MEWSQCKIFRDGMNHGFKRMCIFYEMLTTMELFSNYVIMYIILYKCRYNHYSLFIRLYEEHEEEEKNQANQQNI